MARRMMSGNEAIAQGAYEAGVAVGCGYPGTPSTEILEALFEHRDVYCEWSVNEKVAYEVGLGSALAGGRALVTMKHVGVNVAADPLFTSAYTGVNAGLVCITADDPSMHSSQNEQDNRHYAIAAKIPLFEPADPAEAREHAREAFAFSERFDTPVLLRTTTRLSHSRGVVDLPDDAPIPQRHALGFTKDSAKYVMIPGNARGRRVAVERRLEAMREAAETHPANRVDAGPTGPDSIGIITAGVPYSYIKEVLPDVAVLKLGLVHPLPRRLIEEFATAHGSLYVVEELDPVIETQLRSWGIECHGKDVFPAIGEFSVEIVRAAFGLAQASAVPAAEIAVPPRPPGLCTGCPHGHVYDALREHGVVVSGDIGCYSLGTLPPYSAMDTLVDMGASITMAHGMDAALQDAPGRPRIAAVIGDSTFAHSGLTGLLNACWNKRDGLYIVLDNGTTAMTGSQPNPMSGERIGREDAWHVRYDHLAKAFGIPEDNFRTVDANKKKDVLAAIDDLLDRPGIRLLAVIGMCVIEAKELRKVGKYDEKRAERKVLPLTVTSHPAAHGAVPLEV